MFSSFAISLDSNTHNYARKLAIELDRKYKTDLLATTIPHHISLKSSFQIKDLTEIEKYFDSLAQKIKPFTVEFTKLDIIIFPFQGKETGLVWMDIQENEHLRSLHQILNSELQEIFGIPLSGPDGDGFHFHSTISFGGASPSIYREMENELRGIKLNLLFQAKEIMMFYSPDEKISPGRFFVYKRLPLSITK